MSAQADDSSSSDDDFYQNLTKTMKRKVTNGFGINDSLTDDDSFTKYSNSIMAEPSAKKNKQIEIQEDSDEEDSFEVTNIQKLLETKSKKFEAENKASKVPVQFNVRKTRSTNQIKTHKEIEINSQLLLLESLDAQVKACSSLEKPPVQKPVINNQPLEEDDECVPFLIKNLENPSEASVYRSWKINDPISLLRQEYSSIWSCSHKEIVITCKNLPLNDSDTPTTLEMAKDIQLINIFRVGLEKKKDPNKITIKCLQAEKRPVELEVSKTSTFALIKELIQQRLNIEVISKLIFDSCQIKDDETPEDLDMENEDCVEVYS